ncbi:hypothetical protein Clacol_000474 [Clathrus columnatus]|uniref:HMG box domain-containing protein n=1 Tax=Clathrus columnatus TaxID=1419009 RepID=A0AAV5A0Y3_9AGAM|nr:hypothetical protein Clacol_000474 [Clathrus columnatus]
MVELPSQAPSSFSSTADTTTYITSTITSEDDGQVSLIEEGDPIPEEEYLYPAATASDEDNNDDEEEDKDDDSYNNTKVEFYHYKYRYKNIYSTPERPPSPSTSNCHPQFLELSFNIMTGPDRTTHSSSSHRANPLTPGNQPPRPPNAWILYRSDKLRNIPSPPPGAPKRPQAEVSKMISQMWKLESPDVRGHYERLSEIKKAEHQAMYPGYRFQPMKKEDKDRLRAEKQAEKDREREARKANKKTRTAAVATTEMPPLFTTQARVLPSAATPSSSSSNGMLLSPLSLPVHPLTGTTLAPINASSSSSDPPGDLPTPPGDNDSGTPSSLSLPPPSLITLPPLVAPQPAPIPQRPPSPSTWEEHNSVAGPSTLPSSYQQQRQQQQDSSFSLDNIPTWFDSSLFLPDPSSSSDGYITVPLPSQQPLGWSPDDPGPLSDMHLSFFHPQPSSSSSNSLTSHPTLSLNTTDLPSSSNQTLSDPLPPPPPLTTTISPDQLQLHAVLTATNDPNTFALGFDFTNNELFDGTREIQVSMAPGPSMMLSAFNDIGFNARHENEDIANLLNWDASNFSAGGFPSSYTGENMDYSLPLGLDMGLDMDMDSMNSRDSTMPIEMGMGRVGRPTLSGLSTGLSMSTSMASASTSQTSLVVTPPSSTGGGGDVETRESGEKLYSASNSNSSPKPDFGTSSTSTPYIPPAGAMHTSTRRVAADWRRIRALTPDPDLDSCFNSNHDTGVQA